MVKFGFQIVHSQFVFFYTKDFGTTIQVLNTNHAESYYWCFCKATSDKMTQ
jgi:hypothetical protein